MFSQNPQPFNKLKTRLFTPHHFWNKSGGGFTLIELLVVISIIGLISSIVLVSMKGFGEDAKIARGKKFSSSIQHVLGSEAVGIWRFEKGSGTTAHDESGYGNNGTLINMDNSDWVPGIFGTALEFDGVNDYVEFSHDADSQPDAITIEYWIKLTSDPNTSTANNWRWVISPKGWTNPCHLILEQNRTTCFSVIVGGSQYRHIGGTFSSERLTVGEWTHLVYIYEPSTGWGYAYKNGEISRSGVMVSGGGNLDNSNNGWRISWPSGTSTPSSSGCIPGTIDEVRIYSTALTTAEIQKHYAEGAAAHGIVLK